MYYYEIELNEYNKLITHVYKIMETDLEKIKIYKMLIKGLAFYEGRIINIRIEKVIKKILEPEYKVHYYKSYDWYRLCIYKKSTKFEINLGKDEKENRTRFKLTNLQNDLLKLETKHNNDIKNSSDVINIVSQYNTALKYFRTSENLLRNIPGWYTFDRF